MKQDFQFSMNQVIAHVDLLKIYVIEEKMES